MIRKSRQTSSPQDRAVSLMGLSPFACCENANQIDKPKKTRNPRNPNPQTPKLSDFFISQPKSILQCVCCSESTRPNKTTIHQDIKEEKRRRSRLRQVKSNKPNEEIKSERISCRESESPTN